MARAHQSTSTKATRMSAGHQEPGIQKLVHLGLEYGSLIWDAYQQRPMLRTCLSPSSKVYTWDYSSRDLGSVSIMLYQLGSEPLEHQRAWNRVIMFNKIYHHIVEVPVHHLLHITNSRTHGSMANKISQISKRVDVYKYSFIQATIKARNNIPATFRNLPSWTTLDTLYIPTACVRPSNTTLSTFNLFYHLYRSFVH